jgi:hypothetical protein
MGHSKNIFMEERLVSNCCGAGDAAIGPCDVMASEFDFCPRCGEYCEWIAESQREEEMKVEILTGKKDTNE